MAVATVRMTRQLKHDDTGCSVLASGPAVVGWSPLSLHHSGRQIDGGGGAKGELLSSWLDETTLMYGDPHHNNDESDQLVWEEEDDDDISSIEQNGLPPQACDHLENSGVEEYAMHAVGRARGASGARVLPSTTIL